MTKKGGPHFETRPSLLLHILLFSLFFDPLTCIYESFNPWSYLIAVYAVGGIIGVLPWEDGTLQVRHHCQMAAVCAGQGSYLIIGTVRVARIFVVGVFGYYVVLVFIVWQREFSFSVCYPDTQFAAAQ